MIDCLIFTKDRACQLDALLRSVSENFKELQKITIIFKASTPEFRKGYIKLIKKFKHHNWIIENDLVFDIRNAINKFTSPYCMMFVDDEMVVRNYEMKKPLSLLSELSDIHCISLRMGTNINYTYTADLQSPPPKFINYVHDNTKLFKWNWSIIDNRTDWGYPACINSHIYRTNFFKEKISQINFKNVNHMEGMYNNIRQQFPKNMICFERSKTINVANNLVQSGQNRHSGKEEFSMENLNKRLLDGYIIDIKPFYNIDINMATFEKDYSFIKE